jgi:hypothetical protein
MSIYNVAGRSAFVSLLILTAYMNPRDNFNPFFATECTSKDSNGNCLKVTCKSDATSDCQVFAAGCLRVGANYNGSKDSGECTRASAWRLS